MLNGLDILVTTVPCLLRLMRNPLRFFNKHRMTTIVFDEIDSMCDRFGESDVETIYRTFCVDTKIQVGSSSRLESLTGISYIFLFLSDYRYIKNVAQNRKKVCAKGRCFALHRGIHRSGNLFQCRDHSPVNQSEGSLQTFSLYEL